MGSDIAIPVGNVTRNVYDSIPSEWSNSKCEGQPSHNAIPQVTSSPKMQSFDPVDLLGPRQVEHRLGLKDANNPDKHPGILPLSSGFWGTTFWTKRCFPLTQLLTSPIPRSEDSTFKKPGGCTLMWVLQVVKPWVEWAKRWPCFAASLQLRLVKIILDPPSWPVLTRWQSSDSSLHLLKHQKSVCLKE